MCNSRLVPLCLFYSFLGYTIRAFGDEMHSWRVLDVTIAMAYGMLTTYGKANRSISAAAAILRGYNSVYPLTDMERKLQHLDNLGLQVIDECVIDPELALERAIRHPLLPAEHLDRLDQALLERHAVPGYSRSICVPQDTSAGTKSNRGKQCRRPAD